METPVRLVKQISQSTTSFNLPMQCCCTKIKTGIVSGAAVLTSWCQGHQKSEFKCERGDDEEGKPDPSETSSCSTSIPEQGPQSLKTSQMVPFLNPDQLNQWSRLESIARVWIDGEDS